MPAQAEAAPYSREDARTRILGHPSGEAATVSGVVDPEETRSTISGVFFTSIFLGEPSFANILAATAPSGSVMDRIPA